jgi:hypothetical protein
LSRNKRAFTGPYSYVSRYKSSTVERSQQSGKVLQGLTVWLKPLHQNIKHAAAWQFQRGSETAHSIPDDLVCFSEITSAQPLKEIIFDTAT